MEMNRSRRAVLSIAFFLALIHSTVSTEHKVGGDQGWTMGINLQAWAQNEQFLVGDTLSKSIDLTVRLFFKLNYVESGD